jgi:integrase
MACIPRGIFSHDGREMPLKTAQMLLGHGSITMTADVYGHFPRGDDAAKLAEAERVILG